MPYTMTPLNTTITCTHTHRHAHTQAHMYVHKFTYADKHICTCTKTLVRTRTHVDPMQTHRTVQNPMVCYLDLTAFTC